MSIEKINEWHKRARPSPTDKDFNVQLGCHLEEIAEMMDALRGDVYSDGQLRMDLRHQLDHAARLLKGGHAHFVVTDRKAFLDSLADQVVTSVGVAHCANMNAPGAIAEVDRSNWSKFVDGKPVFNDFGKIMKGPDYHEPDLARFV